MLVTSSPSVNPTLVASTFVELLVCCPSGIREPNRHAADWDEATKSFARRPRHDWASHASDALRYLAQGIPGVAAPSPGRPVRVPMPAYDFTAPARRLVGPGPGSEWL
jgi:hypothetical protein